MPPKAPVSGAIAARSNTLMAPSKIAIMTLAIMTLAIGGAVTTASAETPCDIYVPGHAADACRCGKCGASNAFQQTPVYRVLDSVAGGIEHVFGLDRCNSCRCNALNCDDGCDGGQWLMPIEPQAPMGHSGRKVAPIPAFPRSTQPLTSPGRGVPRLPQVPRFEELPTEPKSEPKLSKPRIVTPPAAPNQTGPRKSADQQPLPGAPKMSQPRLVPVEPKPAQSEMTDGFETPKPSLPPANAAPATPMPPDSEPAPKKNDSLFDALDNLDDLDDPFEDDAARLREPSELIDPTSHRSTTRLPSNRPTSSPPQSYRPTSYQPLYRLQRPRPTAPAQQPIGSGIRPTQTVEPLRQVIYEELMQRQSVPTQPTGTGRVLPPYRPSR